MWSINKQEYPPGYSSYVSSYEDYQASSLYDQLSLEYEQPADQTTHNHHANHIEYVRTSPPASAQQIQASLRQRLHEARLKAVAFAVRSNINYDAQVDHRTLDQDQFIQDFLVSFNVHDFLHIKEKFSDDWWIGRVVKEGCDVGFIPSPIKLESLRLQAATASKILANLVNDNSDQFKRVRHLRTTASNFLNNRNGGGAQGTGKEPAHGSGGLRLFIRKLDQPPPYYVVPAVRPLILIGPSLKGFEVTDMMQKVIFDFLKEQFRDRIIITRVTADISLAKKVEQSRVTVGGKRQSLMERSTNRSLESDLGEVTAEIERIFELARTMQLIALDCDTINHPSQLAKTSLAPILVYVKVASIKILQELIKGRDKAQARHMKCQVNAAEKLIQLPNGAFDVVLDESELKLACGHLAEYLESYWRALHPPPPTEAKAPDAGEDGHSAMLNGHF